MVNRNSKNQIYEALEDVDLEIKKEIEIKLKELKNPCGKISACF